MNLTERVPVVFTAQSKHYFFCRDAVCAFVLRHDRVPLNPFRMFDYFLNDRVDRDVIRRANFNAIRIADELWVFGDTIANGVFAEIKYAAEVQKPIRFFTISANVDDIRELDFDELEVLLKTEAEFSSEMHTTDFQTYIGKVKKWLQAASSRP